MADAPTAYKKVACSIQGLTLPATCRPQLALQQAALAHLACCPHGGASALALSHLCA